MRCWMHILGLPQHNFIVSALHCCMHIQTLTQHSNMTSPLPARQCTSWLSPHNWQPVRLPCMLFISWITTAWRCPQSTACCRTRQAWHLPTLLSMSIVLKSTHGLGIERVWAVTCHCSPRPAHPGHLIQARTTAGQVTAHTGRGSSLSRPISCATLCSMTSCTCNPLLQMSWPSV